MKQSTKNRAAGKVRQVKGKVKEKLANAAGDHKREAEGRHEKELGGAQQHVADLEEMEDLEAVEDQ